MSFSLISNMSQPALICGRGEKFPIHSTTLKNILLGLTRNWLLFLLNYSLLAATFQQFLCGTTKSHYDTQKLIDTNLCGIRRHASVKNIA